MQEGDGGVERPSLFPDEAAQFPIWAIIVIIAVIIIVVAVVAFLFIRRRNQRLAKNLEDYNQLEGTNKGKAMS